MEALYGGAAGGGKSDSILMGGLQYIQVPGYAGLILRRTYADLKLPGAIMSRSFEWLASTKAHWNENDKTWRVPGGGTLTFGYLEADNDKYRYQCMLAGTEIMTVDGWRPLEEVKVGDSVATMDPDTREMSYAPTTAVHKAWFDGELVTAKSKGLDFGVTPNHTMLFSSYNKYRRNGQAKLQRCRADALPATACVPQWCRWTGIDPSETVTLTAKRRGRGANPGGMEITLKTEDWMEFLGWYLSEGSLGVNRITIHQKLTKYVPTIQALFDRMGMPYRGLTFQSRPIVEWLLDNVPRHSEPEKCKKKHSWLKLVPKEIKTYSPRYLNILLDALISGDGTRYSKNRAIFVSSSKQLAMDVDEIAIKCGYRTIWREVPNKEGDGRFPNAHPCYQVHMWKGRGRCGKWAEDRDTLIRTARKPYKGFVHCVTVPPHNTILTRYKGKLLWSGNSSEFQYIGWDELTQFPEGVYRYLISRLRRRKDVNVPLRIRSASNPGGIGHEWCKQRFIVEGRKHNRAFIPAKLGDNPYLDEEEYRRSLKELDPLTRAQLQEGNWDIIPSGGRFKREYFEFADFVPNGSQKVRYWDMAATTPRAGYDPDYTVGLLLAEFDGRYYVEDIQRDRTTPRAIESLIATTAEMDGPRVAIYMEQEPGSAGVMAIDHYRRSILPGYEFRGVKSSGDKASRANPVISQAEAHSLWIVRAGPNGLNQWINDFIDECVSFPEGAHDDMCLVGETEVVTPTGKKRLDSIIPGEYVLGESGWVEVEAAACTGVRPVISNGPLRGTANHPVKTASGWIGLSQVTDTMSVWMLCAQSKNVRALSWSKRDDSQATVVCTTSASIAGHRSDPPTHYALPRSQYAMWKDATNQGNAKHHSVEITTVDSSIMETQPFIKRPNQVAFVLSPLNSMASSSDAIQIVPAITDISRRVGRTFSRVFKHSIKKSGSFTMAPFQRVIKSITETTIRETIGSRTWSCLPVVIMHGSIRRQGVHSDARPNSWRTWQRFEKKQLLGIVHQQAKRGIDNMPLQPALADVYNIKTSDGTYFANGVLTHNCDALSGAMAMLARRLTNIPRIYHMMRCPECKQPVLSPPWMAFAECHKCLWRGLREDVLPYGDDIVDDEILLV